MLLTTKRCFIFMPRVFGFSDVTKSYVGTTVASQKSSTLVLFLASHSTYSFTSL